MPGVAVGHATLIEGEGKLVPGQGPIRTGVTAILPRPKGNWDFVMAATFNQNGNGDMTGVNWIEESGFLEGPILLTGTHSVAWSATPRSNGRSPRAGSSSSPIRWWPRPSTS